MPTRREFLSVTAGVVGGLIIGTAGTLLVRPSTGGTTTEGGTGTVTQTVTQTVTGSQSASITGSQTGAAQSTSSSISQTAVQNLSDLGTLVIGENIAGADNMDPAFTVDGDASWIPINNAYQSFLEWQYPDFKYPAQGLLQSVSQASDGVTWTGKMVSGATFADGTPITSADLVYTIQRGLAVGGPGTGGLAATYYGFIGLLDPTKISAPDPNTVQFVLSAPYTPALVQADLCTIAFNVVNRKLAEANAVATSVTGSGTSAVFTSATDHGSGWMNQGNSAGSGPYVITEWVKDDHITMVANTNYWGQPKPRLKKVIFQHVADADSQLTLLQKGDIDAMWNPVPSQVTANQFTNGLVTSQRQQAVSYMIGMNVRNAPLNNENAWNAIKWSIDYNSLVNNVLGGAGVPMQTLSWQGLPYADLNMPYSLNPTMAKQLLSSGGYASGFSVAMLYNNSDPTSVLMAPAIQSNLAQSGITVTLNGEPGAQYISDFEKGNAQLILFKEGGGLQDISNIAWINLDPSAGLFAEWDGYNDSQAIQLVDACHTASASAAPAANQAMLEYGLQHAPVAVLFQAVYQIISSTGVVGLTIPFSRLNTDFSRVYKQAIAGYT